MDVWAAIVYFCLQTKAAAADDDDDDDDDGDDKWHKGAQTSYEKLFDLPLVKCYGNSLLPTMHHLMITPTLPFVLFFPGIDTQVWLTLPPPKPL